MNTVFDPSILFISEEDWQNPEKRDFFLEHLLAHLENITEHHITQIYWTDELEELLWTHPQLPPWRLDRDWQLKIVPILYDLFAKCRIILEDLEEESLCTMQPPLKTRYDVGEIHDSFLKLMHFLLALEENVYFCVGIDNQLSGDKSYEFHSDTHEFILRPVLINKPDEWFKEIDILGNYWPSAYNDDEVAKLKVALEIMARVELGKSATDEFLYKYELTHTFVRSIIRGRPRAKEILYSMAKRLMLHQKAASSDKGLKDEPLRGQSNVRRFRVTGANRIHYSYSGAKKIEFLNYYREGEHDKGL